MVFVFSPDHLQNIVTTVLRERQCGKKTKRNTQGLFCRLHKLLLSYYTPFICPKVDFNCRDDQLIVFYTGVNEYLVLIKGGPRRKVSSGWRFFSSGWDILVKGRIKVCPTDLGWQRRKRNCRRGSSSSNCETSSGSCSFLKTDDHYLRPGDVYYRSYALAQKAWIEESSWLLEYGRGFFPELFGTTLAVCNPFPGREFFNWIGHTIRTDWIICGNWCLGCWYCCNDKGCKKETSSLLPDVSCSNPGPRLGCHNSCTSLSKGKSKSSQLIGSCASNNNNNNSNNNNYSQDQPITILGPPAQRRLHKPAKYDENNKDERDFIRKRQVKPIVKLYSKSKSKFELLDDDVDNSSNSLSGLIPTESIHPSVFDGYK